MTQSCGRSGRRRFLDRRNFRREHRRWEFRSRPNDSPDIIGVAELPDETKRVGEEKHHHREKDNRANIRQRRDATGDAGREAADHRGRDVKHDIEETEKQKGHRIGRDQIPDSAKGRHRLAALPIHHRHHEFQDEPDHDGDEEESDGKENDYR